jgi:hypothetical protein
MRERSASVVDCDRPDGWQRGESVACTGGNQKPFADPVFVLAVPRSFSSVVCAMLGQHPQAFGLPETNLFAARTLGGWWMYCSRAQASMHDGLLRAIAQIYFGAQTEAAVLRAAGWIQRRSHFSTGLLLEVIAERVSPLMLVEKSPNIVSRAYSLFPQAKFIHLVRHPRAQGESLAKFIAASKVPGWQQLHDPQRLWYIQNVNICDFLESVPESQKLRMRGEELLDDPETHLRLIADWLRLRTDAEAIEMMMHPEQSPFACLGPLGARFGNDPLFLKHPALRPTRAAAQTLDGALSWRNAKQGFLPKVRQLAEQFGYE